MPAEVDVVLIVGGSNDAAVPDLSLARAATQSVAAAKRRARGVALVGPVITDGLAPESLARLRNVLAAAARTAGVPGPSPPPPDGRRRHQRRRSA